MSVLGDHCKFKITYFKLTKGCVHSADKAIRLEYVKMMQTGNYPVSYIARMAKVSSFFLPLPTNLS